MTGLNYLLLGENDTRDKQNLSRTDNPYAKISLKTVPKSKWIISSARLTLIVLILVGSATLIALFFINFPTNRRTHWAKASLEQELCSAIPHNDRYDCYPLSGVTEEKCLSRGCCWKTDSLLFMNVPQCYYPQNYASYKYVNITVSLTGLTAFLKKNISSPYPNDVDMLRMDVQYQTKSTIRIKISDASKKRHESPYPEITKRNGTAVKEPLYSFKIHNDTNGFEVTRSNGDLLFNSTNKGGFIFSDQFLQMSAAFSGKIYGIGQHETNLQLSTNWTRFTLFNQDEIPAQNTNLYGSHPFYLVLEPNGTSHGVFLHNSNAMDVLLQPSPAVTFRTIGGILDFYIFAGPSPADVIQQYTELVGKPFMPPYWSLGFHLCRLGYKNVSHIETVLNRTLDAGIPVDTQWVDIDYMVNRNDFTVNNNSYKELANFVTSLHSTRSMNFVPILDPGISAGEAEGTYPPFEEGKLLDVFIKNYDNSTFIGKVWNKNSTVFPDFTNKKTFFYWTGLIHKLHDKLPFDGLWIDMNEPANFLDGSINGCPDNDLENPPYIPGGGTHKLSRKTICMSAKQFMGSHYDLHNIYGISEAHATSRALREILQRRPFVISRSTFSGSGRYAGHWSGDVTSTWEDMQYTIPQMLLFSMYGIPMTGSDICGFNGNTTKYLCLRWSQLGAFYPFSRNHNTDDGVEQDPAALGEEVAYAAKKALLVRYELLPYLYTLFWRAHVFGETVARPLFFEFPQDENTHAIDQSFLWGCCLLIIPVLKEFATTVDTYLPAGRWYDWYTHEGVDCMGRNITLHAATDNIPVLIRGGAILPTQSPASTATESRTNKMGILAAYDSRLTANGSLYWDDGESLNTHADKAYGLVNFNLTAFSLTSSIAHWNVTDAPALGSIKILGFVKNLTGILVNGLATAYSWNSTSLVLSLQNLNVPINVPLNVTWLL